MIVYVHINGQAKAQPATVIREDRHGRRLLDIDGGPLLVEGVDCEVVPAPEVPS